LVRRRIKTIEVSPEEIGLCGCWRIAAVERTTVNLTLPEAQQIAKTEIAYYVASRPKSELSDQAMLAAILGHWDAIENGTHRVRDVSMGEDACRVGRVRTENGKEISTLNQRRRAACNLVALRNFAIGLYNLHLHQGKTKAPSLPSWRRSMTISQALKQVLR
jgi:hypothetical protein